MVATVLLLVLLLVAAYTDVRWRKIYNWNTYPGILLALAINAAGSLLGEESGWQERLGWVSPTFSDGPFSESLFGFLACGFVMLVCFVFFRIGGGDVKLVAMLGAFLGVEQGIQAMLWTFVLGGALGLVVLIWKVGPVALVVRVVRHLLAVLRIGHSPLTEEERAVLQMPLNLAPTALPAVLIVKFNLLAGVF